MCIGIPMQVLALEPGHATCVGADGMHRRVRTALVGDVAPGDWLLIFIDSAQERIDAQRAAEVQATLDLVATVLSGDGRGAHDAAGPAPAAFELPSRMSREDLLALAGATSTTSP